MLQLSLKKTSDSENSQSKCIIKYIYEIIDEWLTLRVNESLVRVWDIKQNLLYSRIISHMKMITFNLLSYLIHVIIYWLRDSLNYQTHLLNLVHWNFYINKIKISRLYIWEISDQNITLWIFLQYKNDHFCIEVSFNKLS